MNDYEAGEQAGIEYAIAVSLQDMRKDHAEFREFIGKWHAEQHEDWLAVTKANKLGFALSVSATTAGRLILLLQPSIKTRSFDPELEEVNEIYEELSSWDLYTHFGWDVK